VGKMVLKMVDGKEIRVPGRDGKFRSPRSGDEMRQKQFQEKIDWEPIAKVQKAIEAVPDPNARRLVSMMAMALGPDRMCELVAGFAPKQQINMLRKSITELGLSTHAYRILNNMGVKTVADLVVLNKVDLLGQRGCARITLNEIKSAVEGLGLSLGMKLPQNEKMCES